MARERTKNRFGLRRQSRVSSFRSGCMLYVPLPVPTVSELVRPTEVALKIDEIDQKNRRGWSVVMQVVRKESPSPISWHAGGMVMVSFRRRLGLGTCSSRSSLTG